VVFVRDVRTKFRIQLYNLKRSNHLGDLDIDGRIILKLTLTEESVSLWTVHWVRLARGKGSLTSFVKIVVNLRVP
jgi:hypothetical protein